MPFTSRLICFLAFFCLLYSCDDDFTYTGTETDNSIVLEGRARAGDSIEVFLSESKSAFESDTTLTTLSGAEVRVFVNGSLRGLLIDKGEGHYYSDFLVRGGDSILIAARRSGYRTVETEGTVPDTSGLVSIDTIDLKGDFLSYRLRVSHKNELNAYFLSVRSVVYEYELDDQNQIIDSNLVSYPISVSSTSKLFYSERSVIRSRNNFHIFTSEFMNTQPFTLDLLVDREQLLPGAQFSNSQGLVFHFSAIDMGEYRTLESILVNNEIFGGPFGSKNNVTDNIEGGYGIMHFNNTSVDTLMF